MGLYTRQIPQPDVSGVKAELDLGSGYKLVATPGRIGTPLFTLFDDTGKKLGAADGSSGAFQLAGQLFPPDDPNRNQIITAVQFGAPQMQLDVTTQVNTLIVENNALYTPYDNSEFKVTKEIDGNNKGYFSYTLTGPNGFTYDLGKSGEYSPGNANNLLALNSVATEDKKLIGWLNREGDNLENTLKGLVVEAGGDNSAGKKEAETTTDPAKTETSGNANGDPNPNAVITPGTGTNPVANVDVTGPKGVVAPAAPAAPAVTAAKDTRAPDDWRVRLSLASKADYLYNIATPADILYPLRDTNGVIFPYTPQISSSYRANYDPAELTHSNYRMQFYKNSSVDDITITADFTAQDTKEANYLLAVIHFFKSATKMFYGQDSNPRPGTPPPLVYLTGFGAFQFDKHPLAVTNFTYNLPNEVDYIRANATKSYGGASIVSLAGASGKASTASKIRTAINGLKPGATPAAPTFTNLGTKDATYVPTKIQLTISLVPIVTRRDISKNFSFKDYATGKLLRSTRPGGGGGIW